MMQNYEALFILKAVGTEQDVARTSQQLDESIKKAGGTIQKSESMGRRRLAFRISRQSEGYYHLVRFSAPTQSIEPLKRGYRLDDSIVRFMILCEDQSQLTTRRRSSHRRPRAESQSKENTTQAESESDPTLQNTESTARS